MAALANKRPRTSSSSSTLIGSTGNEPINPHKASRTLPLSTTSSTEILESTGAVDHPILCNLPPTCNRQPTPIANTGDLERHYAMYHAHVCELKGCGCVFPEARLLELHQTECHDPIAALRKERNEKIFECHIPAPTCGRSFLTPKARRLHLIQSHSYPKQYFFAVTNKGIGGLLKKWGEGASLVRKEWKPRDGQGKDAHRGASESSMEEDDDEDEEDAMTQDNTAEVDAEEDNDDNSADLEATPRIRPKRVLSPTSQSSHHHQSHHDSSGVAGLTDSLNALSLVPNSVRFGRGGKTAGFRGGPRGGGRGKPAKAPKATAAMDVDQVPQVPVEVVRGGPRGRGRGRGRGYRGRGRG